MSRRFFATIATASALSLGASLLTPVAAIAEEAGVCQQPGLEIQSGSLNWGIKKSWRSYIKGRIAAGQWTTSGAVEGNGQPETSDAFQFVFEVDPANSQIELNPDGTVKSSKIATKDSSIVFTGHHGALESTISNPSVATDGNTVTPIVHYLGYFVPGKAMHAYTPADRIDQYKIEDDGNFAQGTTNGWQLTDTSATLDSAQMAYVTNPGTNEENISGADVLFMGNYKDGDPVDNVNVSLSVKKVCNDPEPEKTSEPAATTTTEEPTKTSEPKKSEPAKTSESKKSEPAKTSEPKKSEPAKTSEPKKSEPAKTSEPKKSEPAKPTNPSGQNDLSSRPNWQKVLIGVLGAAGIVGLVAGIFQALMNANMIPGLNNFLRR